MVRVVRIPTQKNPIIKKKKKVLVSGIIRPVVYDRRNRRRHVH